MATVGFCRASALCARVAALVASAVLLAMMGLMVADVALRYVFNLPITGGYDLVELGMLVTVSLGLAYTGEKGGHVSIDIAEHWLPPRLYRRLAIAAEALAAVLLAVVAWQCVVHAVQLAHFGETANTLRFPLAPLAVVAGVGALLYAMVMAGKLATRCRGFTPEA